MKKNHAQLLGKIDMILLFAMGTFAFLLLWFQYRVTTELKPRPLSASSALDKAFEASPSSKARKATFPTLSASASQLFKDRTLERGDVVEDSLRELVAAAQSSRVKIDMGELEEAPVREKYRDWKKVGKSQTLVPTPFQIHSITTPDAFLQVATSPGKPPGVVQFHVKGVDENGSVRSLTDFIDAPPRTRRLTREKMSDTNLYPVACNFEQATNAAGKFLSQISGRHFRFDREVKLGLNFSLNSARPPFADFVFLPDEYYEGEHCQQFQPHATHIELRLVGKDLQPGQAALVDLKRLLVNVEKEKTPQKYKPLAPDKLSGFIARHGPRFDKGWPSNTIQASVAHGPDVTQ